MTTTSISKLLIANRGEIAVRIARTARRLGMGTVAVYSEPDVNALHVDVVDEAIALGGATPSESYLRGDVIIAAALATGADAIHPGYGFLAENAEFAQQVIDAGLVWVGPTPDQIRLLGDKVAAKKRAMEAGVPTAPLFEIAEGVLPDDVPLPALVKAAAGGGGRGMRIVRDASELASAVEAGSREALAAFGDGTVFVEPYIERARHVEVQIIGDGHGTVLHLGERECSIQRRNQKVVEESPSAGITDEVRSALCDGAVALAASVGYEGAGTIEFLVGEDGRVNFLEVNTRLQVEHPVTEAVTGLDLVELQLLVAAGEPLPMAQDDITIVGHAIEVRVVAEDPTSGWIPSTGTISHFGFPDDVRVDTGVRAGAVISPDYDSLIAKVIAHGPTRQVAARRLQRALSGGVVAGVSTDVDTLVAILNDDDFLAARTSTAFLDEHPELANASGLAEDDHVVLLVAVALMDERANRRADAITGFAPIGWRNLRVRGRRQVWSDRNGDRRIELVSHDGGFEVLVGQWPEPGRDGTLGDDTRRNATVRLLNVTESRCAVEVDGRRVLSDVVLDGDRAVASSAAGTVVFERVPRFVVHEAEMAGSGPICPLPGTVIAVHVEEGDVVEEGDLLMVVEAMKMEHQITAAGDAVVAEVRFAQGDRVDSGDLLVAFESET